MNINAEQPQGAEPIGEFNLHSWIAETQNQLDQELEQIEANRPSLFTRVEQHKQFAERIAAVLAKNELLAELAQQTRQQ